jgi:hypothetical protein
MKHYPITIQFSTVKHDHIIRNQKWIVQQYRCHAEIFSASRFFDNPQILKQPMKRVQGMVQDDD